MTEPNLMLVLMIKNESKIIERCIGSILQHVDAVCIEDTISTDNTLDVIRTYFSEKAPKKVPYKIFEHPWKNFGHNRSISFESAKQFCDELKWNPDNSWALVMDADMCLVILDKWNRNLLDSKNNGYKIMQKNGGLEYFNTRFLRFSSTWKCVGATHEYWSVDPVADIHHSIVYIHDVDDGGAKADKFERDVRLLKQSIEGEPNNPRTWFYLGQSYHCLGKYQESIECYKKRIEIGGWAEETWYSMYMIMKSYLSLKQVSEAEFWCDTSYRFNPQRSENIYLLTKYFRETSKHYKAYQYYLMGCKIEQPPPALFIETDVYKFLFHYERTILDYYVNSESSGNLSRVVNYLNINGCHHYDNVISNMKFYVSKLKNHYTKTLNLPTMGDYIASSPSLVVRTSGIKLINLRYVNYSVGSDGSYIFRDPENHCRTKNMFAYLDNSYNIVSDLFEMENPDLPVVSTRVHGCEDIRVFENNNILHYTATTLEYSSNPSVLCGIYNVQTKKLESSKVLKSPINASCEKNWIYLPNSNLECIYSWFPLRIMRLENSEIIKEYTTPGFFKNMRGSSNFIINGNEIWATTHIVEYDKPRRYYHQIIVLDAVSYRPLRYSLPFIFMDEGIEYCLTMFKEKDDMGFIFSRKDSNPTIMICPLTSFSFQDI